MKSVQVIHVHAEAPQKPAYGEPCNGCGWCCLAEPCPAGIVVSRRRHGACAALVWDASDHRYRCGLIAEPSRFLPRRLEGLAPLLRRWAHRWIAAGQGCDYDAEPER